MAIFVPNNPLAGFSVGTGSLQGPAVVLDDLTGASTSTFLIAGGAVGDEFFISASNFNVKANGNITASNALLAGTITATAGFIGGWTIGSTTLSSNGVVLDSATGQIRTTTDYTIGDGFFLGSGASNNFRVGLAGGSRLQFTGDNIEIYSSNNRVVSLGTVNEIAGFGLTPAAISSSNNQLILRSNGQITGSNVLFNGGRIGGFTLSGDAFSGTNFYISGSATGDNFFISASNFNVKANGNVTASSALFSGSVNVVGTVTATAGAIGGFVITQNALTGSGFFISGSPGTSGTGFFISSSRFNVKGNGDVTGSNVLFTGGRIAGFTISGDTLSNSTNFFISGSATSNDFFISSSRFNVKANGDVTASSALFSGSVSITGNVNATTGNIGGFAITANAITGSGFFLSGSATNNGTSFFISSSKFNVKGNGDITGSQVLFTGGNIAGFTISGDTLSNSTNFFISGSATGNGFFISSSRLNVKASGDITGSQVLFTGGRIGSFVLTNNALNGVRSDNQATSFFISSSVDTTSPDGVAFFISSSRFNVRQDGTISGSNVFFNGGRIGGFSIDSSKITGTNIIIDSAGSIQTADYASDLKGWKISAVDNGFAEFENVRVRGTLKTAVFEKETVNAVGGQLYVANSSTITGSEASSSIPQLVYLKFGGYSGSNAIQNIAGSGNTYVTIASLVTASIANLPTSTQTFKPIGGTGLLIASGSKTANSTANTSVASLPGITTQPSASLTIMAWVRPDFSSYTSITPTGSILEKSGSSGVSSHGPFFIGFVVVSSTTGSLRLGSGNGTNGAGTYTAGTNTLRNNTWTHVAMTVAPAGADYNRTLYVNGILDSTNPTTVFSNTNTSPINIGVGSTFTERFPGYIADVRLYTGSLSATQILTIYSGSYFTGSIEAITPALQVDNVTGFVNGEILSAKKVNNTGFATEYFQVRDTMRLNPSSDTDFSGILYVTRSYGNGVAGDSGSLGNAPSNAQSYEPSQVIVSTGKLGTGFIRINANPNDQATPYIDIVERTGSGIYDVALKARLGDLSGLANSNYVFGRSNPGFGLATDNVFLQGGIIANTGSIGGIQMQSSKLFTGTGTFNDNNTGFYLDASSNFSLGNKLSWNGSVLSVSGTLNATDGNIGGFAITANAITGSGFFLSGSATNSGTSFFLSSSRFNIKGNGDITGSQVLFTGGTVGGFTLSSTQIADAGGSTLLLKSNGQITGSNVLFNGGTIGGFTIGASALTATNFAVNSTAGEIELGTATSFNAGDGIFMSKAGTDNFRVGDAGGARMQFTGDNLEIYNSSNAKLVSIGSTNTIAGFTLSNSTLSNSTNFFISGSSTGDGFFISASNFNVKANGNVTASSALFSGSVSVTGNINARTGNIGGFNITANAITGSRFYLSGSATGDGFFISASNFNIKANGNVTASNMLLNGGVIRSANYSTTAGSEINLADGTFDFGGSSTYYPGIRFDGSVLSVKGDITADTGNFLNVNVRGSVTTTYFTGSDEFLSTGAIQKTALESWTTSSGTLSPTTGWKPITTGSLMSGSVSGISFRLPWKAPRLLWDVDLSTPTQTLTNIVRSCSYDQGPSIGSLLDSEWYYSADSTLYGLPIGTEPYQAGLSFQPQTSGAAGIAQWNFTTGSWQGIRLENVALTDLTVSTVSRPSVTSDKVLIVGFTPDTNRSITARVIIKASSNYPALTGQTTYPYYVTTYEGNESEAFVLKIPLSGIVGYSIVRASQYFEIENGKVDIEIQWKFTGYMGTAPTGVASTRLHEVKILDVPRVDSLAVRNLSIGTGYKSAIVFEPIYPQFNVGVNRSAELRLRNPSYEDDAATGFHDLKAAKVTVMNGVTLSGLATVDGNNDAQTNFIGLGSSNGQIYDDGNLHIHTKAVNQTMWINTNNAPIAFGNQITTAGGSVATGVTMGSSLVTKAYLSVYGGKSYTIGAYGYLFTGGAGTGAGTTATYGIYCNNRIEATEFDATSDERMKDIQGPVELNDAISLVKSIEPIKYTWKEGDDDGLKIGYSAQQVVKSGFGHLVGHILNEDLTETTDADGFVSPEGYQLTMNYDQVTPYHGVVIKHLLEKIEQLEQRIKALESGSL